MKKSLSFLIAIVGLTTPLQASLVKSLISSVVITTCYMSHPTVADAGNTTVSPVLPADYAPPKVIDVIPSICGKRGIPVVVTLPEERYFTGDGPLVLTADCVYSDLQASLFAYSDKPVGCNKEVSWGKMTYSRGTYVWRGFAPNTTLLDAYSKNYLIRFTATDRFGGKVSQEVPMFIKSTGIAAIVTSWATIVALYILGCSLSSFYFIDNKRKVMIYLKNNDYASAVSKAQGRCFCSTYCMNEKGCPDEKKRTKEGIPLEWIRDAKLAQEKAVRLLANNILPVPKIAKKMRMSENLLFELKDKLREKGLIEKPLKDNVLSYVELETYEEFIANEQETTFLVTGK